MTLKRLTLLMAGALGAGWIAAGVAVPAMANDHDADLVIASARAGQGPGAAASGHVVGAPAGGRRTATGPAVSQNFVNQGPHSFGDPMASGRSAAGSTASPNFVNQGPHGFGDPMASGRTAAGSMASPDFVNQGPHAFGGPVAGGAAVTAPVVPASRQATAPSVLSPRSVGAVAPSQDGVRGPAGRG